MAVQTVPGTAPSESTISRVLLVIIAFFLPPLAVGLKEGIGGALLLNIILTLLLWLPGFLHALWIVLR
jgi:uncharacterized membrane protein YqaE (UPF0057 family)